MEYSGKGVRERGGQEYGLAIGESPIVCAKKVRKSIE